MARALKPVPPAEETPPAEVKRRSVAKVLELPWYNFDTKAAADSFVGNFPPDATEMKPVGSDGGYLVRFTSRLEQSLHLAAELRGALKETGQQGAAGVFGDVVALADEVQALRQAGLDVANQVATYKQRLRELLAVSEGEREATALELAAWRMRDLNAAKHVIAQLSGKVDALVPEVERLCGLVEMLRKTTTGETP